MSLALALAAACGGGSKKASTTPSKPAAAADAKTDDALPQTEPEGGSADAADNGTAPQDVEPVVAQPEKPTEQPKPELPKPEPVKPPGNDLPPEKRNAIVNERLRKAAQEIRGRDSDGAIKDARAALDVDETNVDAMVLLAHAYYLKEYDDKAIAVLDIAQSHDAGKTNATAWMLRGLIMDRAPNAEDKALAAYEEAAKINPDYLGALNNEGAIYLKRKRYQDAVTVFEHVINLQSNNPRGHTHLGAAYRGRSAEIGVKDPDQRNQFLSKAELELKTAMAQDANYAPAPFNLGILYLDADPFPGMDTLTRLTNAQRFLNQYKRIAGPKLNPAVDDYLAAAQKAYEREQRAIEKKKKQQEKERTKPKDAPPDTTGAAPAPAPAPTPPPEGGTTP